MLFPTLDFALFFVVVFAVAWALMQRRPARHVFLLAASYFFYGYWDWRFCGLLAFASAVAWLAGRMLEDSDDEKRRKTIVGVACALLLVVLGFFKYYGFFVESLFPVLDALGLERDRLLMQIVLPVGISFFTFQAISYVVDVYRRDVHADRSIVDVFLYISFFPQLVAGPIVRAAHFLPQLERQPVLTRRLGAFGLTMCIIGLFKKMVIANYLASDLVDPVFFDPSAHNGWELLAGVYGYAVQIYCDFSGYSDIAIGTAALLGFYFKPNFNQPYRSASLREFWRRWHISLSQWLRDYLYKPLGGSRHGTWATRRNLVLTMLLGGLWHGAAWTFVLWGLLHGVGLVAERMAGTFRSWPIASRELRSDGLTGGSPLNRRAPGTNELRLLLPWFFTFHVVCAGWILFRAQSLELAGDYFAGFLRFGEGAGTVTGFSLALIALSMAFQFVPGKAHLGLVERIAFKPLWLLAILFALALLAVDLIAPPGVAPFIYFQF